MGPYRDWADPLPDHAPRGMRGLSSTSLAAGILLCIAVMHLLDVRWNLMNIAVLPLIIGITDNSIHFIHALRHNRDQRLCSQKSIAAVVRETGIPF